MKFVRNTVQSRTSASVVKVMDTTGHIKTRRQRQKRFYDINCTYHKITEREHKYVQSELL